MPSILLTESRHCLACSTRWHRNVAFVNKSVCFKISVNPFSIIFIKCFYDFFSKINLVNLHKTSFWVCFLSLFFSVLILFFSGRLFLFKIILYVFMRVVLGGQFFKWRTVWRKKMGWKWCRQFWGLPARVHISLKFDII